MKTQEFFKEWQGKYPKSFEKFFIYWRKHINQYQKYNNYNYHSFNEFSFEMLTGVIDKFFIENKIDIVEIFNQYFLNCIDVEKFTNFDYYFNCKQKADLKAAEILEGR